jgi:uncharacterized protein (UPF0147 family)
MSLRLDRRAAIEVAVCGICVAFAVLVVLTLLTVRGWQRGLTGGDERFVATPLPPTVNPTGQPPPLPPPMRWRLPSGVGARIGESLLGVGDDVAFRRALADYRAALPNANEQQQFEFDRELPAKRIRAQRALTAVSIDDPDRRVRSRALNMLAILEKSGPTPTDPVEQRTQILSVIGLLRSAIKVDPNDEDAKLNLELMLRDPQTEAFIGPDPSGTNDQGLKGGTGEAGQGY